MLSVISRPAAALEPSTTHPERVLGDGRCVLVVEDMDSIRSLLHAVLSLNGYRPVCAASGHEALALAAQEHPELVVLDLVLPDIDGLDLMAQLLGPDAQHPRPVVVVTARPRDEAGDQAMAAGAVAYLEKPFDPHRLLAELHNAQAHAA